MIAAELPPRDAAPGWRVVAGCSIGSIFGLMSVLVGAIPTLAVAMERDTGWSRGAIMGIIGVVVLTGAVFGPYVGKLVDSQGARRWILVGQAGLSLGLVAAAYLGLSMLSFYGLMLIAALFAVGASPISYSKVIIPWFDARRGMALGLSAVGIGLAAIALPLITAPLAAAVGWRETLAIFGIVAFFVGLPIQILLIRDYPRVASITPVIDEPAGIMRVFAETWARFPHFRVVIAIFAVMGLAHAGIVLNMVPMQIDKGMDPTLAAGTQSALGVALIFGRVIGGWLLDRFGSPKPLLLGILPAAIGIAMLGTVSDWRLVYLAACLIGLGSGIENDGIPYLISRYFPQEHFAKLSASIQSLSALALALGPAIAATTYDATGGYFLACMISTALLSVVGLMVFSLPDYDRTPIGLRTMPEAG
jgi:MFS family permease